MNNNNLVTRGRWKKIIDQIAGENATSGELWLQFFPAVLSAIALPYYSLINGIDWHIIQILFAGLLALDLVGGIITNATNTAKQWYHRPSQGFWQHFSFVTLHLVHIALVAWIFRGGDMIFWITVSIYLLMASTIILKTPLTLQRPVAMGCYTIVLLGNCYLFTPTLGLEWFLNLFFLKILISHLIKEKPIQQI